MSRDCSRCELNVCLFVCLSDSFSAQMTSSQYQRTVPLEVRRGEGERVRAKHPDKIPVSSTAQAFTECTLTYLS